MLLVTHFSIDYENLGVFIGLWAKPTLAIKNFKMVDAMKVS
jgi:hypothetical protein